MKEMDAFEQAYKNGMQAAAEKILSVGEMYANEYDNKALGFGLFMAWIQTTFGIERNDEDKGE